MVKLLPVILALLLLLLAGCESQTAAPQVTAESPTRTKQLSKVAAAVGQAQEDLQGISPSPHKDAVEIQLGVAQAGLPQPSADDRREAKEISELAIRGELDVAKKRARDLEAELSDLREKADREAQEAKARIEKIIADYEAKLKQAKADADREAYLRVVSVFAIIGGIVSLIGIACAVTGWSRVGILCIPAGILIGGSGLLWGKPWFIWTMGGAVILCAVAGGIWWAVSIYEQRKLH